MRYCVVLSRAENVRVHAGEFNGSLLKRRETRTLRQQPLFRPPRFENDPAVVAAGLHDLAVLKLIAALNVIRPPVRTDTRHS